MTEIWQTDYDLYGLAEYVEDIDEKIKLGSGGFGSVVETPYKGSLFAAKVSKGKGGSYQEQFENEKQSARMKHNNLLRLFYYGENRQCYYLLYERMPRTLINEIMDLNWDDILKILKGIAEAIKCLHDNGYVHGDIKPHNVLLTDENEPKLGDFGSMVKIGTGKSAPVASEGYFSRNDRKNFGEPSKTVDIFAFGIMILQLIAKETETQKTKEGRGAETLPLNEFLRKYPRDLVHRNLKRDEGKADSTVALAKRCTLELGRPPIQDVCDELSRI